jgi:hypothetical protein
LIRILPPNPLLSRKRPKPALCKQRVGTYREPKQKRPKHRGCHLSRSFLMIPPSLRPSQTPPPPKPQTTSNTSCSHIRLRSQLQLRQLSVVLTCLKHKYHLRETLPLPHQTTHSIRQILRPTTTSDAWRARPRIYWVHVRSRWQALSTAIFAVLHTTGMRVFVRTSRQRLRYAPTYRYPRHYESANLTLSTPTRCA